MAGTTDHFGLSRVSAGDKFSDGSYKYTDTDRARIDSLLYTGTTAHHHDGTSSASTNLTLGLNLTVDTTTGAIPAGTRVYYKYTLVDVAGNETGASPESWVETAQSLSSPNAPTLTAEPGSGTLLPGNYYYILSVYEDTISQETLALNPSWVSLRATGSISLTLPTLPVGGLGFNVYRKKPGDFSYFYLASVPSGAPTYVDNGSTLSDSTRVVPSTNSTNASNAVTISFPGATPTVPAGFTWKIYRTYAAGNYQNSLVHHVVEETVSGSGIITAHYEDLGAATFTGQPPAQSYGFDAPDRILLDGMTEVQGSLPPVGVVGFPWQITLELDGHVTGTSEVATSAFAFPFGTVMGAIAWCTTAPAGFFAVNVDVYRALDATPHTNSLIDGDIDFTTGDHWHDVVYGDLFPDARSVNFGDIFKLKIVTNDMGATPTVANISVTLFGWANFTNASSTNPPAWI